MSDFGEVADDQDPLNKTHFGRKPEGSNRQRSRVRYSPDTENLQSPNSLLSCQH